MTLRLALILTLVACDQPVDSDDDTSPPEPVYDCEPGSRTGPVGRNDDQTTTEWFSYNVRTPDSYDATVAHPLLMVYAPAGANASTTEQFTALTTPALDAGYVVVYAQHLSPRTVEAIEPMGRMAAEVTDLWCIDKERVYLTGHSDGGTISSVVALFDMAGFKPAAIAPSAAGISSGLLQTLECPGRQPVMVLHSRNDGLFPPSGGFGQGAAAWWAACNACDATAGASDIAGCVSYNNCAEGAEVLYCEHSGSHGTWPRMNDAMLTFFAGHGG